MEREIERELEIRGAVGYIAKKHHLSQEAAADVFKIYREQAIRWESKLGAHASRICNQRKEITKLLAALNQREGK